MHYLHMNVIDSKSVIHANLKLSSIEWSKWQNCMFYNLYLGFLWINLSLKWIGPCADLMKGWKYFMRISINFRCHLGMSYSIFIYSSKISIIYFAMSKCDDAMHQFSVFPYIRNRDLWTLQCRAKLTKYIIIINSTSCSKIHNCKH